MKRLIIVIALLLVSLPVLLLAVLILAQVELDLAPYRDSINRLASMATEQQVAVDGDLRLAFGMQPSLALSQLRVADGQDDSRVLAKVERLFAQANLGVLLGGRLDVLEFELAGGELNLRVDAAGQKNWVYGESDDESAEFELDEAYLPQHARINISDSKLRFEDQQQGTRWALDLTTAHAELSDVDAPLELRVEGVWNELPLKVSGNVSPSPDARGPNAPQLVSFTAQLLGIETKAEGIITDLGRGTQRLELTIDSRTSELMRLRDIFGDVVPAVKRAALNCKIKDGSGILQVSDIDARFDKTKIAGDLSLNRAGERPKIEGKLQLTDLDTRLWANSNASAKVTSAAEEVSFLEHLAHLPPPSPIDVKLSLIGRNVLLPNEMKHNITVDINVDEHNLDVELTELDPFKVPFKASLRKQRHGQGMPTYLLKLSDPDVDLAEWAGYVGLAGQVEGEMLVDIELRSSGVSAEQISKALEGHARLLMGAGRANVAELDRLVAGLTAAVGQAFTDKRLAVVNCSAADIAITGGQAKIALGLIDTAYATVLIDGNVDLVNQTLDLRVTPRKKALSLRVAPKVMIKGSAEAPEFIIEKGSLFLSLGKFLANVAYPPSLFLDVFDEAARGNPCVAMLSGEDAPSTAEPVAVKPAGAALEKSAGGQEPRQRIHGADLLED